MVRGTTSQPSRRRLSVIGYSCFWFPYRSFRHIARNGQKTMLTVRQKRQYIRHTSVSQTKRKTAGDRSLAVLFIDVSLRRQFPTPILVEKKMV
jgi:hypothetical protein